MNIKCECDKLANTRKNRIGTEFTYYTCEDEKCKYEIPLCHCVEIAQSMRSEQNTHYYVCSQNNCDFIIAICKCNKICSIKFSKKAGLLFWSCKRFPRFYNCNACSFLSLMLLRNIF